jgi:hypothetical protein
VSPAESGSTAPEPGSLHDPSSRVFSRGDEVLRGLNGAAVGDVTAVLDATFFQRWVADRRCVSSQVVDPSLVGLQGWEAALTHERLEPITFPYEWTFSMLKDAALLHLDLELDALADGFTTKDATPFNVQFDGAQPMFIDIGSFERVVDGQPWIGYGQFCEMFLNPLLVQAYCGIEARHTLRGSTRGLTPGVTVKALPRKARMRPSVFSHVVLHAWAQRRYQDSDADVASELKRAGMGRAVVVAQVRKLRSLVASLDWDPQGSTWSDYGDRSHYESAELGLKAAFVERVAAQRHRRLVVDVGANDGTFVEPVRASSNRVVALDGDSVVVDRLYRRLHAAGDRQVTPMCVDFSDPSGGIGWAGRQRTPLFDRIKADLVLLLAVVHHVVISDSVPLPQFMQAVRELADEAVLEFPLPGDPKVERLIRNKAGRPIHPYSEQALLEAVAPLFDVVEREVLPSGTRVLFHLSARP